MSEPMRFITQIHSYSLPFIFVQIHRFVICDSMADSRICGELTNTQSLDIGKETREGTSAHMLPSTSTVTIEMFV